MKLPQSSIVASIKKSVYRIRRYCKNKKQAWEYQWESTYLRESILITLAFPRKNRKVVDDWLENKIDLPLSTLIKSIR